MPVNLSVSQVRQALFLQSGGGTAAGNGQASTRLLGSLFHDAFQQMLRPDGPASWNRVFPVEPPQLERWREALEQQVYQHIVGPQIEQHAAALQQDAVQVHHFWQAVQHLVAWIAELVWTVYQSRKELPPPESLVSTEERLQWKLREPGWSDEVVLSGAADAVWRPPGRNEWCIAELKLGRTHALADLGQACLYQRMLSATDTSPSEPGPIALVSFKPGREEQLFSPDRLLQAHSRLIELIGELAKVRGPATTSAQVGDATEQAPAAVPPRSEPSQAHRALGERLLQTLREYDARAELAGPPEAGPAFIKFPLLPERGVRVSKITRLAEEIKVRLGLEQNPFINSEGGRLSVDLQRHDRQCVTLEDVRAQLPATDAARGCSKVIIGVDTRFELALADLAAPENCHLLVAGTTGSGKSEWLRSALAGLCATNTPDTLRLILIDPKRNAFRDYEGSDYLLRPIVYPDEESAVDVFRALAEEMERRYQSMGGADSFEIYLAEKGAPLPRIVCVCDEYFDLVHRGKKVGEELEDTVFRLGAKARAAGIHLVLATQQPSREVIRGALDVNIPARVALKTSKAIESRMLLGQSGAEHLLGCGDLLFKDIGSPRRFQGVYTGHGERTRS